MSAAPPPRERRIAGYVMLALAGLSILYGLVRMTQGVAGEIPLFIAGAVCAAAGLLFLATAKRAG